MPEGRGKSGGRAVLTFLLFCALGAVLWLRPWTLEAWDRGGALLFDALSDCVPGPGAAEATRPRPPLCVDEPEKLTASAQSAAVKKEPASKAAAQRAPGPKVAVIPRVKKMLAKQEFAPALRTLEQAEREPGKTWGFGFALLKAQVLGGLGRMDEAGQVLDAALGLPDSDWRAVSRLRIDLLVGANRYIEALAVVLEALGREPENIGFMAARNRVYITLNRYEEALDGVREALRLRPDDGVQLLELASVYAAMGEYEKGIAPARRAAALLPDRGRTHRVLSNIYSGIGDYGRAMDEINVAVDAQPENVDNYLDRGAIFVKLGKFDLALGDAQTAVKLKPGKWNNYDFLGNVHRFMGNFEIALNAFAKGEELGAREPAVYKLWCNRAFLYLENGMPAEAAAGFSRAIALRPEDTELYLRRFDALCQSGDLEAASADARRIAALEPEREDLKVIWRRLMELAAESGMEDLQTSARQRLDRLEPEPEEGGRINR